jgi:hypothetical protein
MPRTAPVPLTREQNALVARLKEMIRQEVERRWPLPARWGGSAWTVQKSARQDGAALRIALVWREGPTVSEVAAAIEDVVRPELPVDQRIVLSMRREPQIDHRRPALHYVERTA